MTLLELASLQFRSEALPDNIKYKLNQSSKNTCARRDKNKQTITSGRFGTNL